MRVLMFGVMIFGLLACSVQKSGGGDSSSSDDSDEGEGADTEETPEIVEGNHGNLIFLSPTKDEQIVLNGETFELDVEFGQVAPTSRWGLYYSTKKNSFLGGIAIIEDLPIITFGVPWDVSFVEPGVYYVYAMLTDSSVTTVHFAPGSFKVEGEASGNTAPKVNFAAPSGDRIYAPGDEVVVTFNGSDKDEDSFTFDIEYTSDGSRWTEIVADLSADETQYTWTIPDNAPKTARYSIRVNASDGKNTGSAQISKVFGVTDETVTFDDQMSTVFAAKCTSCHSGSVPQEMLDLESYGNPANLVGANARTETILSRTRKGGGMPPAAEDQLTAAEQDLIQFWIWQDAPQN